MSLELTVVVPTYNERDNVARVIDALESVLSPQSWEVIFVDDDSPDGTAELVRQIAAGSPHVRCIQRLGRRGLSSACIEGILASSTPYICVMDADMQHDESILPAMLAELKENQADIVIGSRYMESGSTGGLAKYRVWVSRAATAVGKLVLKHQVTDSMSGYFMLSRAFFEKVMRRLSGKGFKILLDILVSSDTATRYKELPYVMRQRVSGESKLSFTVVWEFFTLIADKILGRIFPLRFLSFIAVGFSGVFVHLFVLWLMHQFWGGEFVLSQAVATLVAMTSNYILNNSFTYRDRQLKGIKFIRGLFSFYLACSLGAIINVAFADWLYEVTSIWWLAGILGAVVGAVWNYAMTAVLTWGDKAVNEKSG